MNPAIVIFTFNRPNSLKRLLDDLRQSSSFGEFPLVIYIDGARNDRERRLVEETAKLAHQFHHSNKLICRSGTNLGLKKSLVSGVTSVLHKHGSAIILEDDLRLGENALEYFRKGLDKYSSEKQVISICGYSVDFRRPSASNGAYFLPMTHPWGWATWSDRWQEHLLFSECNFNISNAEFKHSFNVQGLRNFFEMYKLAEKRWISSWWIYWHLYSVRRGGLSLFPESSQVLNSGITGESGTHSSEWNPFYKLIRNRSVSNVCPSLPEVISIGFEELARIKKSREARVLRLIGFIGSAKRVFRNIFRR